MIPPILIQTNEYIVPPHVESELKKRAQGWEYRFFTHEYIINYFNELHDETNETNETNEDASICRTLCNAICKGHDITASTVSNATRLKLSDIIQLHEVFAFYYLYLTGGVYIDAGIMLESDLSEIMANHSFVTIESCLTPVIFAGVIGCIPRHPILRKVLQHICNYVEQFQECSKNGTPFDVTTIKISAIMYEYCKEFKDGVTLLNEIIFPNQNNAIIYDKGASNDPIVPLFTHYFVDKLIRTATAATVPQNPATSTGTTLIGISASVPSHMFNNGIHQNTLYFYDVLKQIGYTPYLIVTNSDYLKFKKNPPDGWNRSHYENVVSISQIYTIGFHAVVTFGVQISHVVLQQLRYMGVKLVSYVCGNEYLINSESILYGHGESGAFEQEKTNQRKSLFDEVWLIPQMMGMNECYKRTLSRCAKVIEAPFIWSPKGIEAIAEKNGATLNDFVYVNVKKEKSKCKKLATFDPNISVMKWFLPSFVLCERAYQLAPQLIDRIYVTNAFREKIGDTLNAKKIENTVRYTDLFLDKRVFFEKRFIAFEFMKTHADVAVFHQWGNPLNYIYLEMAWLGYPFVHNAHLCSDLGYYYEDYNLEQGAEVLLSAIMKHDSVAHEYLRINRERVDRYLPTNVDLQQKYKKMFDDLFYEP